MNWFDLTILGIIGLSVIVSLFRGLIREVLSLLIWIGAFWLAWTFVDSGAEQLTNWIELSSARHLISFVGLFLAALIIGGLVNYTVGKMIQKSGLGATDKFFGIFFGALRGMVAVTALVFFIKATPFSEDPWWQESRLAPHFSTIADWIREKMPEDLSGYFSFSQVLTKQAGSLTNTLNQDSKVEDSEAQATEEEPEK
ncbi:MAG: CvpA family protein [Proteobacteria bacterium]|nr:CvpA family protein [Pseudomonadota bacterium]